VIFRILATLAVLLLSAPSALGVQRALAPTRGDLAGWLAAVGIELAYLSLAFAAFEDQRRQRLAVRVARAAVLTAITLNVLADYAARAPGGLSSAAAFTATFDWLLLALAVLESAPLAALAYTLATLLHSSAQSHTSHTDAHTSHTDAHTSYPKADMDTSYPKADTEAYAHTAHTSQSHTAHTAHTSHTSQSHTSYTDTSHTAHPSYTDAHTTHTTQQQRIADAGQSHPKADTHTAHPKADTHMSQSHIAHTDTQADTAHPQSQSHSHSQRTTSYRCPHCGAALVRQQQYAAAKRYGHCAACRTRSHAVDAQR